MKTSIAITFILATSCFSDALSEETSRTECMQYVEKLGAHLRKSSTTAWETEVLEKVCSEKEGAAPKACEFVQKWPEIADVKMSTVFNATFLVDHINENTSDWPDSCTRCHDRTYEMRGFIKSEKEIEKVNYLLTESFCNYGYVALYKFGLPILDELLASNDGMDFVCSPAVADQCEGANECSEYVEKLAAHLGKPETAAWEATTVLNATCTAIKESAALDDTVEVPEVCSFSDDFVGMWKKIVDLKNPILFDPEVVCKKIQEKRYSRDTDGTDATSCARCNSRTKKIVQLIKAKKEMKKINKRLAADLCPGKDRKNCDYVKLYNFGLPLLADAMASEAGTDFVCSAAVADKCGGEQ